MLIRHAPPSKIDTASTGTLCKVSNSSNRVEIYKQISQDEENPIWILIDESIVSNNPFNGTISDKITDVSGEV